VNYALQKHLIFCAQVLVHSSHYGLSASNLNLFGPKKQYLGSRNFKYNNNVGTAVHKLFEQQKSFVGSTILDPGKEIGQVDLLLGVFSGTACSIMFCRKSQFT
jgi:hypothetical protein